MGAADELATFYGPICGNVGRATRCSCAQLVGTQSDQPIEVATVVDRDITPDELEAVMVRYLTRTGWYKPAPEQARELAAAMAFDVADIASEFPVGTQIHARYDHRNDQWTFYEPEPPPKRRKRVLI